MPRPEHHLQGRVETLAFQDGGIHQIFELFHAGATGPPVGDRMPEDHLTFFRPQFEVTHPELFVHGADKVMYGRVFRLGDLQVEVAGEVHAADLFVPHEPEMVRAPTARQFNGQLAIAGPVERPVVRAHKLFEKIDGVDRGTRVVGETFHGVGTLPSFAAPGWRVPLAGRPGKATYG